MTYMSDGRQCITLTLGGRPVLEPIRPPTPRTDLES